MVALNDFLEANIVNVTRFLSEVNVSVFTNLLISNSLHLFRRNSHLQVLRMNRTSGWKQLTMNPTPSSFTDSSISMRTRLEKSY